MILINKNPYKEKSLFFGLSRASAEINLKTQSVIAIFIRCYAKMYFA